MFSIYDYTFGYPDVIMFILFSLIFSYQLYYYFRYINGIYKNNKYEELGKLTFAEKKEPVSVIICAKEELENLQSFLPDILNQDYPNYEVIVVNDGNDEGTNLFLSDLKKIYPHLKSTFVPSDAKNLSTKKLALTLGIKAAKNEWLLLTDADCKPEGEKWISSMARNFTESTDIVLGYGAYFNEPSFLNRLITYDTLFSALQYLGFAKKGKAYMGVGRNLAYKKQVFYDNNGFAGTLNLLSGDDDLMINKAASTSNTRIESSRESITWSHPKRKFMSWYFQKERHLSVSSHYTDKSRLSVGIEPLTRGLFYALFIVLLVVSILKMNWILLGATTFLFLVRWITQVIIINKASKYYGGRLYILSLILFDVFLPLVTLFILSFGRMGNKSKGIVWK